jgi:hypothetical protein
MQLKCQAVLAALAAEADGLAWPLHHVLIVVLRILRGVVRGPPGRLKSEYEWPKENLRLTIYN